MTVSADGPTSFNYPVFAHSIAASGPISAAASFNGSFRALPTATGGEAAVAFYRNPNRFFTGPGDVWFLGHNVSSNGDRTFGLSTSALGIVSSVAPDGSTSFNYPVSASSLHATGDITARGHVRAMSPADGAFRAFPEFTDGEAGIGFFRHSNLRNMFPGDFYIMGHNVYSAGPGNLGLGARGPGLIARFTPDGSTSFLYPVSAPTGRFQSVAATGSVSAGSIGVQSPFNMFGAFFMGPSGGYSNVPLQLNAELTVDGTMRAGGLIVPSPYDDLGAFVLGPGGGYAKVPLTIDELVLGATTARLPAPLTYSVGSQGAFTAYYLLGKWQGVAQTGRMLKLSVLACARGYTIASNGNAILNPSMIELDIYFHTSNGVDNFDGMYGNGWCVSRHVSSRPLAVVVRFVSAYEYWFYVKLAGLPGDILVTATSSPGTTWRRDIQGPLSVLPTPYNNVKPLVIAAEMNSMNGSFSNTWVS
jgi:hypothetical protein